MSTGTFNFQKLTPVTSAELGIYGKALDFVFINDDIKNVAISGAYSAGKSSILETYKRNNNKKYLHISLAHFESPYTDKRDKVKESVLEGKILNQLIHQIPPSKIPQTNFRIKRSISFNRILLLTFSLLIFCLSIAHIFFFGRWGDISMKLLQ
jgi:hypothetical protein